MIYLYLVSFVSLFFSCSFKPIFAQEASPSQGKVKETQEKNDTNKKCKSCKNRIQETQEKNNDANKKRKLNKNEKQKDLLADDKPAGLSGPRKKTNKKN